jgi:hypothetical protein
LAKHHWTDGKLPVLGLLFILSIGGWLLGHIHESNLYWPAKFVAWIVIGAAIIAGIVGGAHFCDRAKFEHDLKHDMKQKDQT